MAGLGRSEDCRVGFPGLLAVFLSSTAVCLAAVVSDDFNRCTLDQAVWTVVDPSGGATVSLADMATPAAHVAISIPPVIVASPPNYATQIDQGARLLQANSQRNFEIQAKFDSAVSNAYQLQGLIAETSGRDHVSLTVVHDGAATVLVGLTRQDGAVQVRGQQTVAATGPVWLGMLRASGNWRLRYSLDGTTWTELARFRADIFTQQTGIIAAHHQLSPTAPWVAKVDYFLSLRDPLREEDGSGTTLTRTVTGQGTIAVDPDQDAYFCDETVTLTATPAEGWAFQGWSGDLTGTTGIQSLTMDVSRNVHATFVPQPLITGVFADPFDLTARVIVETHRPATATLRYGPTTAYEGGERYSTAYLTRHVFELEGLLAGTTYHFDITCTDEQQQSETSGDAVFTTLPTGLKSDDFNGWNVDSRLWRLVDPLNDANIDIVGTNTNDARLRINVPSGASHTIWTQGVRVPRAMQSIANSNFSAFAKFDSVLESCYQMQGIVIEGYDGRFIRVEFYHDGNSYHHYVAAFNPVEARSILNTTLPGIAPAYLKVTRSGDNWSTAYSTDGTLWHAGATFRYAINLHSVGPYAGNQGSPAPAFVGLVDYFFNSTQPIDPEDEPCGHDLLPPTVFAIRPVCRPDGVAVTWKTDEPASSAVDYGHTTAYELGTITDAEPKTFHQAMLTSPTGGTMYHFRLRCTDATGNRSTSADVTVDTTAAPTINLWYGHAQEFGHWGRPQPMVNVLGNVSSSDGVTALSYSLNNGPFLPLSMGPNSMRLADAGDFNVELPFANLLPGANTVAIRAADSVGRQRQETVSVINSSGPLWPMPYAIDWSTAATINDVAQVTDGLWAIEAGTVRPVVTAYDRLIAIGDLAWQNYEVTVPVTVHAIDPDGYVPPSYGPGVGVVVRWPGHSDDGSQPRQGIYPLGAIGLYRWTSTSNNFQIFGNNGYILAQADSSQMLELGVTYTFKVRVQTAGTKAEYRFKWWPTGQPEPPDWGLVGLQGVSQDPGAGSVLLLAHHVDASFGAVSVAALP